MKILLILAQPADAAARQLAAACHRHALPARVVTAQELAAAPTWHVVATTAATTWHLTLPDGTELSEATVAGIYCRLLGIRSPYSFAAPEDADYAAAELQALIAGWLRHVRVPLLAPVQPAGLAQPPANGWQQLRELAAAGLPVPATACLTAPQRWAGLPAIPFSAAHPAWAARGGAWLQEPLPGEPATALVVGRQVLGAPTPELGAALLQLSRQLAAPLLSVGFARTATGAWRATGYHFLPDWSRPAAAAAFVRWVRRQLPELSTLAFAQP